MYYEPGVTAHGLPHDPFKSCVVPRPIGWISTVDREGRHNLAPFSQFQNVTFDPPIVMFSANQNTRGRRKDTVTNVESTGEFVWSMATYDLREAVNISAEELPPDVDEFERAGVGKTPSRLVAPVRVTQSPIHFECVHLQTLRLPGAPGGSVMGTVDVVFGRVVAVHVDDAVLTPDGQVDVLRIRPLARLGYWQYTSIESVFSMRIPGSAAVNAGLEGSVDKVVTEVVTSRPFAERVPHPSPGGVRPRNDRHTGQLRGDRPGHFVAAVRRVRRVVVGGVATTASRNVGDVVSCELEIPELPQAWPARPATAGFAGPAELFGSAGLIGSAGLVGRVEVQAVATDLLERVRYGAGGALAVLGAPGVGRSALLAAVRAEAPDFVQLGARGVADETGLPFAGLHRLLPALAGLLGELPVAQSAPLREMFDEGRPGDVGASLGPAVHRLLTVAAAGRPVLCWLDDAHLLDDASLEVLAYVARRLDDVAVGLVAAFQTNPETMGRETLPGAREIDLTPLDAASSTALVHGLALPPWVRTTDVVAQVVELAGGVPLALVELVSALPPVEPEAGWRPSLPVSSRLGARYRDQFAALPVPAQDLVLLAVVDDGLDVDTFVAAADASGLDLDQVELAVAAGLLRVDHPLVGVGHPLVRVALGQHAPIGRLRAAHGRLAGVLGDERHRLRRALHRADAAVADNAGLAAELAGAAAVAGAAGQLSEAGRGYTRAAQLAADLHSRADYLLAAASAVWRHGGHDTAATLVRQAALLASGSDQQGRAELLIGQLEVGRGQPTRGHQVLVEAADRLADSGNRQARTALVHAAEATCLAGDLHRYLAMAGQFTELARRDRSTATLIVVEQYLGVSAVLRGRPDLATEPLNRVIACAQGRGRPGDGACDGASERAPDCADDLADPAVDIAATVAAMAVGADRSAYEFAQRAVVRAQACGTAGLVPLALDFHALSALRMGRLPVVAASAAEGMRLAADCGQANYATAHLATASLAAALQGDHETAADQAATALRQASSRGLARPAAIATWALGCLDLQASAPAAAASRFGLVLRAGAASAHAAVALAVVPYFVEAAVRCGKTDRATESWQVFDAWATTTGSASRLALSRRCQAMLSSNPAHAEEYFQQALRHHLDNDGDGGFEYARTALLYGQELRRGRRGRVARGYLHDALNIFGQCGATYWEERARAELRASGEVTLPASNAALGELTAQQIQVARLVAQGATNREIAAQLVVSPRTVDYHLRNIFTKVGVRSRVELARLML